MLISWEQLDAAFTGRFKRLISSDKTLPGEVETELTDEAWAGPPVSTEGLHMPVVVKNQRLVSLVSKATHHPTVQTCGCNVTWGVAIWKKFWAALKRCDYLRLVALYLSASSFCWCLAQLIVEKPRFFDKGFLFRPLAVPAGFSIGYLIRQLIVKRLN